MKIVVLGCDVSAVQAIEKIRQDDPDAQITLLSFEKSGPYHRDQLIDLLAQRSSRQAVLYKSEDHLKNLRVEKLDNCQIERLSVTRKTVTLADKQKIEFDKLIIAGCEKYRTPDIKGSHRQGIYHLKTLDDCDTFLKQLPVLDTVFVFSDTLYGMNIAAALAQRGKEVVLCGSKDFLLQGEVSQSVAQDLKAFLEGLGVRLLTGCQIAEILGEQEIKAVRLDPGKVMATDALIMPELVMDLRVYSGLAISDGCLSVDAGMRTSAEDIFAIGEPVVSRYNYGMGRYLSTEAMAESLYEGMAGRLPQDGMLDQKEEFEVAGRQFPFGDVDSEAVSGFQEEPENPDCGSCQEVLEVVENDVNSVEKSQGAI